ncbi:hypothetical protein PIROE2DRAFT_15853 [Piromyces sp. E2]|nr:hypothetical protein PIROE2DRAFT_15853 [Piromyces sp. E2]|eukprot:OUM58800.1 hypothetical protein PIROE2DRAFT_15853 [Piromyces sp. E2]
MCLDRPYYENLNTHPYIYYVVFGVKDKELNISKERHRIEGIPEGLNITLLTEEKNGEYMNSLINNTIGNLMKKDNLKLYKEVIKTKNWAVINGTIVKDENLNYMKDVIGIVQAFLETGAIGVLDLQIISLYSSDEWKNKIFIPKFNPCSHVNILCTDIDKEIIWLHTRGLRKYGRPDVSIENVNKSNIDDPIDIINQIIIYSSKGSFFRNSSKLHTSKGKTFIINLTFIEDYDNVDFNNAAYYKIMWNECKLVE